MQNKLIDMTGQVCGYLTVIQKAPTRVSPSGNHVTRWKCRCICGKELEVDAYALRSGNTKSCGCKNKKKIKDISGQRFGMLEVESFLKLENHVTYWNCKCDCGNKTVVAKANLLNGCTKSCGCLRSVGESVIQKELERLNIQFIHNAVFDTLVNENGNMLEFDFAIKSNGKIEFLLEYQGEQHYQPWNKYGIYQREKSDPLKKEWCTVNNIELHEIKYNEDTVARLHEILLNHKLIPCQASDEDEGVTTILKRST